MRSAAPRPRPRSRYWAFLRSPLARVRMPFLPTPCSRAACAALQHFPQDPEGWRVGDHLGRTAHDFARATRARGGSNGSGHRQPKLEIGGKRGGFDGEVGYVAGNPSMNSGGQGAQDSRPITRSSGAPMWCGSSPTPRVVCGSSARLPSNA